MKILVTVLSLTFIFVSLASPAYCDIITLYPQVDVFIDGVSWAQNWSYNTDELKVGKAAGASNFWRSFLKFDLSDIPQDSTITQAALWLNAFEHSGSINYYLYHVADDDSVTNTMTWNNQPSHGALLDSITISSAWGLAGIWNSWDLLANDSWVYADDLEDGSVSLGIFYSALTGHAKFRSSEWEHGNNPYLEINYQRQVVPIPGAVWLLASGLAGVALYRRKVKGAKGN